MSFFRSYLFFCVLGLVLLDFALDLRIVAAQDSNEDVQPTSTSASITIQMESYSFSPSTLQGEVGKPLEFLLKNESFLVPHNFLLDSPDGVRLLEVNVDSGEEMAVSFTPQQPGRYLFYCDKQLLFFPNHREEGMEGVLEVR